MHRAKQICAETQGQSLKYQQSQFEQMEVCVEIYVRCLEILYL